MSRKAIALVLLSLAVVLLVKFFPVDPLARSGGHSTKASTTRHPSVSELSEVSRVSHWLNLHHQLPNYYIRKGDARRQGWLPQRNNLCVVLPGRVIGGDHFSNREGRLPEKKGRQWFEADVNYQCGHRNGERLLYSNDGQQYLTTDHYRTFRARL